MSARRYMLSGGGTSGHVNPALAIARQIQKEEPDAEILFLGTEKGIEKDLVSREGFPFLTIPARPLPACLSLDVFRAAYTFWIGKRSCRHLIRTWRPDAVIGTGGFVCSPVVAAAASCGVPVLLHEQNAWPGRSNRLMSRKSQAVCVAFPGTERYFPKKSNVTVTGNPVLPAFFEVNRQWAREQLQIDDKRPFILAFGGSLGARTINQAILGLNGWAQQRQLLKGKPPPSVLLAAGSRQYETVKKTGEAFADWLKVIDYLHDMPLYMAAADLLICRAGALTCSEIAAVGRPAILVPYPYAAGDHQTQNARILADAGAALMCADDQLTPEWLQKQLDWLLSEPGRLDEMGKQAKRLARPDAGQAIYRQLISILKP